ncbi:MAG: hypothetical protein PHE83_18710, partial [Opitutaceae bacterium]|nr:hypothetical protein [Opitutaceae bacterium]
GLRPVFYRGALFPAKVFEAVMVPCGRPFAKKGRPMRSALGFSESPFMPLHRLIVLCLSEWISYFFTVVPPRSRRSLPELICGC